MFIADLHIHSSYSRATSRDCVPEYLDLWARRKGIDLVGTGDFTHPVWRAELAEKLAPAGDGLYRLKDEYRIQDATASALSAPRFVLTGEISSIYKKNGKVRKVHNVILLPGLEEAALLAQRLEAVGNLHSDGRPILGLDSRDLLEITLETCPQAVFIPAHIWTPHFSLFGAFSGFDTIEECFGDLTGHIHALETGLSSDPPMNWRLSALDNYKLVSNSDAHSPSKLGREANLFDAPLSYETLYAALGEGKDGLLHGTIEFFPEEGKYHFDGHRNCQQCLTPAQSEAASGRCPVCGGKLTIGVLHRVEQLADRMAGFRPATAQPFESLAPLLEIIAASTGYTPTCARVQECYTSMLGALGSEFSILRETPVEDLKRVAGPCVAEGVRRVRAGELEMSPGYDGEYGKLHILDESEAEALSGQMCLFPGISPKKKNSTKKTSPLPKPCRKSTLERAENTIETVLNGQQQMAAESDTAYTAVIAGPGTGKTRTLVSRIEKLIENGVKPSRITAVTFTNKAAQEMRDRLSARLENKRAAKAVQIGTFHAICLRALSARGPVNVIDEYDARTVAEQVRQTLSLKLSARKLLDEISRRKNGVPLQEELPEEAFALYQERLAEYGALDYDDLLIRALEYFENEAEPKALLAFTHLLVDEFQDINGLQYRLVQSWKQEVGSVFAIGDPDQSIYGFRGADADCFARFVADCGAQTIRLTQNYRSTPQILNCACAVIAHNGGGDRCLEATGDGVPVRLVNCADEFAQAVFIAKALNRMVGGIDMLGARQDLERGFSDFAVLYRTHRQAQILEKCLTIEGIPYVVAGRDKTLADDMVRASISFFRLLRNPGDAFARRTCARLLAPGWEQLAAEFLPRAEKEKPRNLLESWIAASGISGEAVERLRGMSMFYSSLDSFLEALALGREIDVARSGGKSYLAESVRLMTLHGAKGLEFPVVFLCGLQRGILPLDAPGRINDVAEERRLFYVGMTRAKEELILLSTPEPSPFLKDLPDGGYQTQRATEYKRPQQQEQLCLF